MGDDRVAEELADEQHVRFADLMLERHERHGRAALLGHVHPDQLVHAARELVVVLRQVAPVERGARGDPGVRGDRRSGLGQRRPGGSEGAGFSLPPHTLQVVDAVIHTDSQRDGAERRGGDAEGDVQPSHGAEHPQHRHRGGQRRQQTGDGRTGEQTDGEKGPQQGQQQRGDLGAHDGGDHRLAHRHVAGEAQLGAQRRQVLPVIPADRGHQIRRLLVVRVLQVDGHHRPPQLVVDHFPTTVLAATHVETVQRQIHPAGRFGDATPLLVAPHPQIGDGLELAGGTQHAPHPGAGGGEGLEDLQRSQQIR